MRNFLYCNFANLKKLQNYNTHINSYNDDDDDDLGWQYHIYVNLFTPLSTS